MVALLSIPVWICILLIGLVSLALSVMVGHAASYSPEDFFGRDVREITPWAIGFSILTLSSFGCFTVILFKLRSYRLKLQEKTDDYNKLFRRMTIAAPSHTVPAPRKRYVPVDEKDSA